MAEFCRMGTVLLATAIGLLRYRQRCAAHCCTRHAWLTGRTNCMLGFAKSATPVQYVYYTWSGGVGSNGSVTWRSRKKRRVEEGQAGVHTWETREAMDGNRLVVWKTEEAPSHRHCPQAQQTRFPVYSAAASSAAASGAAASPAASAAGAPSAAFSPFLGAVFQ